MSNNLYHVITTRGGRGQGGENRVLMLGHRLDFQEENGYPRLIDENVAFPTEMVLVDGIEPDGKTVPEPVEVPAEVMPEKWCYTKEDGFFENTEYKEPVAPEAEA